MKAIFATTVLLAFLLIVSMSNSFAQHHQQGDKLVGTGAVGGWVGQGISVALSADGNTAIVGGLYDNFTKGAVWVYTRSHRVWTQQGSKLVGTGAVGNAYQGISVAFSADGNTAIVGGAADNYDVGAMWVFTRSGGVWTQQGDKLVGTGAVGVAGQAHCVALSADGNTAIMGGPWDNSDAGAAWVFIRSGGIWTQQGNKLVGTGAVGSARQGVSVSLSADGNTAIVGGYEDDSYAGAAWIFTRTGSVWTQQGDKLVGTDAVGVAQQGISVALSGDGNTAIVGGNNDNGFGGAAWVYTRSGGVWTQQGSELVGTGAVGIFVHQGVSVALSFNGNTAIVGGDGDSSYAGAAWVFTRSGGVWTQQGDKLVGAGAVDSANQGRSVALSADGNTAIVGGVGDDSVKGAAWVFTRPGGGTIGFGVQKRWNIVSVPLTMSDYAKTVLFPSATTSAYTFDDLYVTSDTLQNGKGYWMQFAESEAILHDGLERTDDTIAVAEGWNMVGGLSSSLAVEHIGSIPGGLVTSPFFKYDKGYTVSPTIDPFVGYWVKVAGPGSLVMIADTCEPCPPCECPPSLACPNRIRIKDTGELPPPPPGEISSKPPDVHTLEQNYPNPFNPLTSIRYALPGSEYVRLSVFNILGQEVAVLVDEIQEAGLKTVSFDASSFPSGVYTYRLTAGTFTETMKMLLLK